MGRVFLTALFVLMCAGPALAGTQFFEALPDVPIAGGLQVLPEQDLIFDKPEGRIAHITSIVDGSVDSASVLGFYSDTLPSFGWKALGDKRYSRGQEILKFWIDANEGQRFFHLEIEPANR